MLSTQVSARISKPVHEVFEAVIDPAKLSKFFATGEATAGRLEAGATVTWDFHDFPGAFPVKVVEVVPDQKIVLMWGSGDDTAEGVAFVPHDNRVTILFEAIGPERTLVTISEAGWADTRSGRTQSLRNTEGWTGMVLALKVWLEHGINLRAGTYK